MKAIFAVIAPVIVILALGCGSSDSDSETVAALTKAQFLAKGDQICKERLKEKDETVKAAVEEVAATGSTEVPKQLQEEVGENIVSTYQKIADELGALQPPASDEAKVEEITDKMDVGLQKAEANPMSVARTDYFGPAADAARSYGLSTCNL
jgi:hypothetical protein